MATDPALDALISELAASLDRSRRAAFEAAARAALATANCTGIGAAYRLLAPLQRDFWDPPDDQRIGAPRGPANRRPSKLMAGPPIGVEDPRAIARARNAFRAG
jgi:hypothetical protein